MINKGTQHWGFDAGHRHALANFTNDQFIEHSIKCIIENEDVQAGRFHFNESIFKDAKGFSLLIPTDRQSHR